MITGSEVMREWVNVRPRLAARLVGPLLEGLDAALTEKGFIVAHLKVMDESPTGWVKASIVSNGGERFVQGNLDASPVAKHELLLNARAVGSPDDLRRVVENQPAAIPGAVRIRSMQCFSPAPPKPEQRVGYVVTDAD